MGLASSLVLGLAALQGGAGVEMGSTVWSVACGSLGSRAWSLESRVGAAPWSGPKALLPSRAASELPTEQAVAEAF